MVMPSASMEMSAGAVSHAATPPGKLDESLAVLRDHAREFARLGPAARAALLRECMPRIVAVARPWFEAAARAKGLPLDEPHSAEEWFGGPITTIRNVRLLAASLEQIAAAGKPRLGPRAFSTTYDGRTLVEVFPPHPIDAALFAGFTARVRMERGMQPRDVRDRQASFYSRRDPEGGVSLVLGAGNVASIPPMDALYKMFVDGNVCIVKMNPVNEYLGPFLEDAFQPLIERGYLRLAYGGGDVGSYLVNHPAVTDVHITGSDRTHDLIVWGPPGPERERRMEQNDPVLKKSITSELGCVTPVVIVPGRFSESELQFVAENIATMVANNASCNCNAAKMLVTSKHWPQREDLLRRVRVLLAGHAPRKAYYPGANDRYCSLLDGRDNVLKVGVAEKDALPWALVWGLDPADRNERLFTTEPFAPILSETALPEREPAEFLAAATRFCNERLWGTLSASVIVHPETEKEPSASAALEKTVAELRYGAVAINHWPGLVYGTVTPPWGAHPSSTLKNIQGGLGWVHNTFMLEGIEKVVLRGPLTVFPRPPWFITHQQSHRVAEKIFAMEADPSWLKLPGIALTAMRG
jgi:acyl-CoA reductase-like NAD-dependent aldehyde dehydrogenase